MTQASDKNFFISGCGRKIFGKKYFFIGGRQKKYFIGGSRKKYFIGRSRKNDAMIYGGQYLINDHFYLVDSILFGGQYLINDNRIKNSRITTPLFSGQQAAI